MTIILKAKPVIEKKVEELKSKVNDLKSKGIEPNLQVILVGQHEPSVIYTNNKKKFCERVGAKCDIVCLDESISEADFLNAVAKIANDPAVHGCFVQLPLPKQLKHIDVGELIPPKKDVDGFHAMNLHQLLVGSRGESDLIPCTPKGVITLLNHYGINLSGKNVVIIGRSLIVGKPLQMLMTNHDATVTLAHSKTKNTKDLCQAADVIVTAVGNPKFLDKNYLDPARKDQVLIDVGIGRDKDGNLCGDMNYADLVDHCEAVTPVPGGIGPMTILSLIENLIQAAQKLQ